MSLLAKRGVIVSHETIRQWCGKFGAEYARRLKRREGRLGDTWHLDELFVTIQGERQYLWRAVALRVEIPSFWVIYRVGIHPIDACPEFTLGRSH